MEIILCDSKYDAEHDSVGFREVTKIIVTQENSLAFDKL